MKSLKQVFRLIHINIILARNGLDAFIFSFWLLAPFQFLLFLNPWNWFRKKKHPRGVALRLSLEELGPIFIKFGQALSTRPDILPSDIALELCKLQDNVPPFPSQQAIAIVENAFAKPLAEIFLNFDPIPLASASIGQVHAATLHNGEEVVVKILRPGMRSIIEQDLNILYTLATLASRYWPESKRLRPKELVREFQESLLQELDLQREAANASQLKRNFLNSDLLYIPEVYWEYTHENIMVMERIHGIPISNRAQLEDLGIDIKKLAARGVEIFFLQVFRDCFFHADMHPGNIFVSPDHLEDPQYICIDFGIVGTLNEQDKRYIAENLYAFFKRDYRRVAELHVLSGWVAPETRIEAFESDIRTLCEPIFKKPLKEISFGQLVLRLFQVTQKYQMQVQPQLLLLQKTLLAIEGLGRQLYPDLDLWATAKPFLEKWMREQIGPKAFLKRLGDNLPFFSEQLPYMPKLINDVLEWTKEEKISALARAKHNNLFPKAANDSAWYGFGLGIVLSMASISILSYIKVITFEQLPLFAFSFALIGGLMALFAPKNRS